MKRATDTAYRESQRKICRENNLKRYHSDSEYRDRVLSYAPVQNAKRSERRKNDPDFLKMCLEREAVYRDKRKLEDPQILRVYAKRAYMKMMCDPELRCREAWRTLLKRSVRAGWVKVHSTQEELGYSPEQLRNHLESLFTDGMSWDNYGEWHIDHVRPISSFQVGCSPSEVHALENLCPMWAADNLSKGSKWEG